MTQAWHAFALTTVALFFKMFLTAAVQGLVRVRSRTFVNPEDAAFFGRTPQAAADHPVAERAQRALRNDLENIPIFLFLALAYVQLGCWEGGAMLYFPVFVLTRALHTIAFVRPTQPLRNLAYLVGVLVSMILSGHIVATIVDG